MTAVACVARAEIAVEARGSALVIHPLIPVLP
jgi:hypothetical protein